MAYDYSNEENTEAFDDMQDAIRESNEQDFLMAALNQESGSEGIGEVW